MEWTKEQLRTLGLCPCGQPRAKGRAKCGMCRNRYKYTPTDKKPETKLLMLNWKALAAVIKQEVIRQYQALQ